MSAYANLEMFYKLQPTPNGVIRDRWALAGYLANKYGNHTQKEYASALRDKEGSKAWNPESAESAAKKLKEKKELKKRSLPEWD